MSETFEEIVSGMDVDTFCEFDRPTDPLSLKASVFRSLYRGVFREPNAYYMKTSHFPGMRDVGPVEIDLGALDGGLLEGAGYAVIHASPDAQHYYIERAPGAPHRDRKRDPLRRTPQQVRELFNSYAAHWREDTMFESSVSRIISHEAYQKIIGLGPAVVPLIINELRTDSEHWFWALNSIVGINAAEGTDSIEGAAQAWVNWFEASISEASDS